MKKRKKFWIVDLGEALTKIVVGVINESGIIDISDIRIEKTPEQFRPEAKPEKKPKIRGYLRPLLKGHHRKDEVTLLINHKDMMVATFTFPMMPINEVEDAIYLQMELLISENLEQWRIDFVARERTQWFEHLGMDDKNLDVLGVAAERTLLTWYTKIFRKIGCELSAIVPQSYAFDTLMTQNGGQPTLIIDMGKKCTRLLYFQGDALSENHRIDLEVHWDGETYLQQIIKAAEQIFISPLGCEKAGDNGNIYLMGGESLCPGVLEYLTKRMNREIRPTYDLLDEKEELIFPRQMSKAELCLITPCVCGLIKSAQIKSAVGLYEA
ncbi:MAG: hypothetical protein CVU99_03725 [Firmicutes bacterium HGW-Firmicutes-4]|nr:MAG: hypothetical protein CVU99_03725 [Firmicutes bacterium HGW-Firmicutes-4]